MSVLILLMAASLTIAVAFLALFVWAVRSGQFDDTTTPAMRMVADDEPLECRSKASALGAEAPLRQGKAQASAFAKATADEPRAHSKTEPRNHDK